MAAAARCHPICKLISLLIATVLSLAPRNLARILNLARSCNTRHPLSTCSAAKHQQSTLNLISNTRVQLALCAPARSALRRANTGAQINFQFRLAHSLLRLNIRLGTAARPQHGHCTSCTQRQREPINAMQRSERESGTRPATSTSNRAAHTRCSVPSTQPTLHIINCKLFMCMPCCPHR